MSKTPTAPSFIKGPKLYTYILYSIDKINIKP